MKKDAEDIKRNIDVHLTLINSSLGSIQRNEAIILQKAEESAKKLAEECKEPHEDINAARKNVKKRLKEVVKIAKQNKNLLIKEEGKKTIVVDSGKILFRITKPKANIKSKEKLL